MQGSKVCIIWPPTLIAGSFFSKRWRDVPQEQVSIIHWFRWGYVCYVYVTERKATTIIVLLIALCFCAVPTANGTAGSQLSTPRSGKSPSPSPTSPASLRRRRVITEILLDLLSMIIYRLRLSEAVYRFFPTVNSTWTFPWIKWICENCFMTLSLITFSSFKILPWKKRHWIYGSVLMLFVPLRDPKVTACSSSTTCLWLRMKTGQTT